VLAGETSSLGSILPSLIYHQNSDHPTRGRFSMHQRGLQRGQTLGRDVLDWLGEDELDEPQLARRYRSSSIRHLICD
jgi:hypothetical protein